MGQGFKCSLQNVAVWFVKNFMREVFTTNVSALGVNKRLFYKYCMANTVIARTVDFSIQVEAAFILAKDTGDEGHRLLKFSNYNDLSSRELWQIMSISSNTSSCRSLTVRGAPRWTAGLQQPHSSKQVRMFPFALIRLCLLPLLVLLLLPYCNETMRVEKMSS